jgi:predicted ATP-grasp superfamily ATP-dependent carboligase
LLHNLSHEYLSPGVSVYPIRVLVTDGEQRSALAIVRSLGRAGYHVEVTSTAGRSLAGASRYSRNDHTVPDALEEPVRYGETILALCEQRAIGTLMPVTEASLRVLLPLRSRLSGVLLPFPPYDTFARVSDKEAILAAAAELGIGVPEQTTIFRRNGVAELSIQYPVVLKPWVSVVSDGGRNRKLGVVHVDNPTNLESALAGLPDAAFPILAQRRIVGPGIGIFLLRWNDRTVARFAHRRIREKPPSGGVSVYRESVAVSEEWFDQAERLLESVGWSGVAMVEFKVDDATGLPYLMEVNGRFWGSLQLAVDAGIDFPRLLLEAASGEPTAEPPGYRSGIRLRWEWGDSDHLLARLRRSDEMLHLPPGSPSRLSTIAQVLLPWRPGERWEVLRPSDPKPFLRETGLWFRRR